MTECCLFVWCRPRSFVRLVCDIYPKNNKGLDADLKTSASKMGKLQDYLDLYPRKTPLLLSYLQKKIFQDFTSRRVGFVNIGLDVFSALLENSPDSDLISDYVHATLLFIFSSKEVPSSCYIKITSLFNMYTSICSDSSEPLKLIESILLFCSRQANSSDSVLVGLELLVQACELLALNPDKFSNYLQSLISYLLPLLSRQEEHLLQPGEQRDGAVTAMQRTAADLSLTCITTLATCPSLLCVEELTMALTKYFSKQSWAPFKLVIHILKSVSESASVSSKSHFPMSR